MNQSHEQKSLGLDAQNIINIWDQGSRLGPGARALYIAAVATPGITIQELEQVRLSERDALLLAIRAQTLGNLMTAVTPCPDCGERAEITFSAEQIGLGISVDLKPVVTEIIECEGHEVELNPITAGNLARLDDMTSIATGSEFLLQQAVISIDGKSAIAINKEMLGPIDMALEQLDPLASINLLVTCHKCNHDWPMAFDAGQYFWEEIKTLAHNLMLDVAELAKNFHWSESEILAMSARRRRMYLEMI